MTNDIKNGTSRRGGAARDIDLADVNYWVFDLDNTLYHQSFNLFPQVEKLMVSYIMEKLQLAEGPARQLKTNYFLAHGTTLKGLMDNHQIDPTEFLEMVHDIDYSILPRNDGLAQNLKKLRGEKYIFTNGNRNHALATLDQLGIALETFTKLVAIEDVDYIPKPQAAAYDQFFAQCPNIVRDRSVFIDDIADNLKTGKQFGMKTVWLRADSHPNNPKDSGQHGRLDYIDVTIDDIDSFLASLVK
ncbi:MAG: pyrimidine 5'-nucleotidase [Hydrotalea sp.]|nr:pyrimidine 5'-nucleotidase [Hydrotalea sp.]